MSAPTVPYAQVHSPAPRISTSPQGLTAIVRYNVAWEHAFTFVNEIMGIQDGDPWIWPASPNMRAYNADIEPIGLRDDVKTQTKDNSYGSSPGEYYERAVIAVSFGSQAVLAAMPYDSIVGLPPADQFDPADPIEMSTYQVAYGMEAIKVPNGSLVWAANKADLTPQTIPAGTRPPECGHAYYRVPTFQLDITLNNCLYVDWSVIRNKIGCVNSTTIFTNCAPETLLLEGVKTNRRGMSDGIVILDVALKYNWKSIGWNVALAENGEFYRYIRKGSTLLYEEADIHPNSVLPPPTRWKPYNLNGIPGK